MKTKQAATHRVHLFVLGVVILLATGLRLPSLDTKCLWGDEVNTAVLSVRMPITYIVTHMHPNNHTLFSLMAHLFALGGANDFSLRVPTAMLDICAVPALYRLGLAIFSPTTGLVAATLLAISPYHIWSSKEARGYTGAVLFSVLSLLFLALAIRHGQRRHVAGFILRTALALYTHLFSVLLLGISLCILAGHLLDRIVSEQRKRNKSFRVLCPWLISLTILAFLLAVLYAPLWLAILSVIDKSHAGAYVSSVSYTTDWTLDFASLIGLLRRFGGSLFREWLPVAKVTFACFCLGIVVSLVRRRRAALALVGLFVIPFLLVAALTEWWAGFYAYSRFFIVLLPIYLLFTAQGLASIGRAAVAAMARRPRVRIPRKLSTGVLVVLLYGVPSVPALRQV